MIFLGMTLVFGKIVWNLFEIVSDPVTNERKIVCCNFKSGNNKKPKISTFFFFKFL